MPIWVMSRKLVVFDSGAHHCSPRTIKNKTGRDVPEGTNKTKQMHQNQSGESIARDPVNSPSSHHEAAADVALMLPRLVLSLSLIRAGSMGQSAANVSKVSALVPQYTAPAITYISCYVTRLAVVARGGADRQTHWKRRISLLMCLFLSSRISPTTSESLLPPYSRSQRSPPVMARSCAQHS